MTFPWQYIRQFSNSYTHIHVHINPHTHVHANKHIIPLHGNIFDSFQISTHTYTYTYTYIHTHIYIYIYNTSPWQYIRQFSNFQGPTPFPLPPSTNILACMRVRVCARTRVLHECCVCVSMCVRDPPQISTRTVTRIYTATHCNKLQTTATHCNTL